MRVPFLHILKGLCALEVLLDRWKPCSASPGPALPPPRLPCAGAGELDRHRVRNSQTPHGWICIILFLHLLLKLNFKKRLFHLRCYSIHLLKPFLRRKSNGRLWHSILSSHLQFYLTVWGLTESDFALKSRAVFLKVPYTVAPKYDML